MFNIKNLFKNPMKTQSFLGKDGAQPQGKIELLKKRYIKQRHRWLRFHERKQKIKEYVAIADININVQKLSRNIFNGAVLINIALSAYLIYYFSATYGISWSTVIASMAVVWVLIFILLIFALWLIFYFIVDLKIFRRKVDIEVVLPDFLELTASNINAGMTIDRALWYAVRPRFGVLAKEIEIVAKDTMSGADLKNSLEKFASRYDSVILKRSISMINEGMQAGGRIGELLNRIALDIQEQKSMLKEMSAGVTTYVIFITFASIVAAPFLFALSGVLVDVVQNLGSVLGSTSNAAARLGIPLTFSGTGVNESDFNIFAILSLVITSLFSAMMISTIKKGNIKSGVHYIPLFIMVSLTIYFIAHEIVSRLIEVFI